jgi:beta-carotene 3-hydroxylase
VTSVAIWIAVAFPVAATMELWAALLHGRVWHGVLWGVHRSHHRRRAGHFESNDLLSALHAPIAIALILYGCLGEPGALREVAFGAGLGMTLFGLAYVLVHDGLVHGRLPVGFLARVGYFARIRDAHLTHHTRGGREPFGLFLGPRELARASRRACASRSTEHGRAHGADRGPSARARGA